MNYKEFLNCQNYKHKIYNNKKLIEIQQKIINAKLLKTQEKYIKTFNKLKANNDYLSCLIK